MRRPAPDVRLPPWWVEVLVGLLGYGAYECVQVLITGSASTAVDRARALWALEGRLHLNPEITLNHLLGGNHVLVVLAGVYYGLFHFVATPSALVMLRLRRRERYVNLRNALVGVSVVALVVFWILPTAPPRLAVAGVIDTLKVNKILSAGAPSWPASLANPYAAMPSLHVAWAIWVALALVVAFPGRRVRYLAWLYPVTTTLVVLATGNHFLADGVASAVLVGFVWWVIRIRAAESSADLRRAEGGGRGSLAAGKVSR